MGEANPVKRFQTANGSMFVNKTDTMLLIVDDQLREVSTSFFDQIQTWWGKIKSDIC